MSSEEETYQALLIQTWRNVFSLAIISYFWDDYGDPSMRRNRKKRERYASLTYEEKLRRNHRVPRPALNLPKLSPWYYLYSSNNEQGFITVTGLDFASFRLLLQQFAPIYYSHSPYVDEEGNIRELNSDERRGRPRLLNAEACLGMVLFWTRTMCHNWTIAAFFGMTGTPCDLWLRFGKVVLLQILQEREDAAIQMPSEAKLRDYVGSIGSKYRHLDDVAYVGDGLKVLIQKAGDNLVQNAFYNGWKCDHFVTNLFLFAPDGTIVAAIVNCPRVSFSSWRQNVRCTPVFRCKTE